MHGTNGFIWNINKNRIELINEIKRNITFLFFFYDHALYQTSTASQYIFKTNKFALNDIVNIPIGSPVDVNELYITNNECAYLTTG